MWKAGRARDEEAEELNALVESLRADLRSRDLRQVINPPINPPLLVNALYWSTVVRERRIVVTDLWLTDCGREAEELNALVESLRADLRSRDLRQVTNPSAIHERTADE